jgi:hypothetical protein
MAQISMASTPISTVMVQKLGIILADLDAPALKTNATAGIKIVPIG